MPHRKERIEQEIQRQVSRILLERLHDRRMAWFSVTAVHATADLRRAVVYLSILGAPEQVRQTLDVLEKARGFVRRELGPALRLRHVPDLEFREDEELRRESRVEEILDRLKRESGPNAGSGILMPDESEDGEEQ